METKHIIFDLCGVLVEDTYDFLLRESAKTAGVDFHTFMAEIRDDFNQLELGYINEEEVLKRIVERYNLPIKVEDLKKQLICGFIKINGSWEIAKKLKKNYSLSILSNLGEDIVKKEENDSELATIFDNLIFSSKQGYRKPDPRLFQYTLELLNAKPEECIFIDDKKRNADAASELGIKTIVFENPKQLEKELKNLNIIFSSRESNTQ